MKGTAMQKFKGLVMVLLVGAALGSQGCLGRVIGEGAEKTLGPKGAFWEVQPVASSPDHRSLAEYKNFELGSVKNDIGKNVPSKFLQEFPVEFAKRMKKSGLPQDRSGKTLVFNVSIIHYETADAADNVLGPLEQVVARVELADKQSNQVLAQGTAIGRTGKSVGTGTEWKAWGLSRALIKWAKAYYPKSDESDKEDNSKPNE
jgi:hypothetical protein